jgi:hypothetical protein
VKAEDREVEIGGGYPVGQLAQAFATALGHEDPDTRKRALGRIDRWTAVLKGMASGRVRVGSRSPVADLPVWATPEVVRGGFATGAAAAGGPLEPWEREVARQAGVATSRGALFAYYLTADGLVALETMLTSRGYAVAVPEEAALPTVAWLARAGHADQAVKLVETLAPHAERLRFVPRSAAPDKAPRDVVWRRTAGQTASALERRKPNARVESMREALTVWNPFADELLGHWLETVAEGKVGAMRPAGWDERGRALLQRYAALANKHTRCTKHRKPKENLAIMRAALAESLDGELTLRGRGLLQHAVDAMLARRGAPGTSAHSQLRAAQAADASRPSHRSLARVVVGRLAESTSTEGVESTEPFVAPVSAQEADARGLPTGTPIPASVCAVVERALAATPEELIERGSIPSAEVLAELAPRITASAVGLTYADEALGSLMAANYEAFRRRRSLLLLNLEHQVRVDELPWVAAVAPFRSRSEAADASATSALARLAGLAIEAFPATIMPSPLVTELDILGRGAGLDLPLVEELAADIFMGTFSSKFLRAAKLAGQLLDDSLYARYYAIDYHAIEAIDDLQDRGRGQGARTSAAFDALCVARAGVSTRGGFSVAANGAVIEQAQILTTHNLAALVGPRGVGHAIALDWPALAARCFDHVLVLARRLHNNPRPLRTVKDLAYAWRQMTFFLSMTASGEQSALVRAARERLASQPSHVSDRIDPALDAIAAAIAGDVLDIDGPPQRRPLLGWAVGPHWLLERR